MDIVIIGAGGHGKVVLDILRAAGQHRPVGFLDADAALAGSQIQGLPVLGHVNLLSKLRQQKVRGGIVAIGDNRARVSYARLIVEQGMELVNAIHPSAMISPTAKLGRNVVIAAGAAVCTEADIGDSTIINTASVVDHECRVGQGVHLCPGALLAGRVTVADGVFVGLGAKVIQCLSIGAHATIGAGAVIIHDVPPGATVVGVPGRVVGAD